MVDSRWRLQGERSLESVGMVLGAVEPGLRCIAETGWELARSALGKDRRVVAVDQMSSVEQVIGLMNQVVARDGGLITLRSYDPGEALEVDYRVEINEDCPTCTVSGAMLETFLAESLRAHGVAVEKVVVSEQ